MVGVHRPPFHYGLNSILHVCSTYHSRRFSAALLHIHMPDTHANRIMGWSSRRVLIAKDEDLCYIMPLPWLKTMDIPVVRLDSEYRSQAKSFRALILAVLYYTLGKPTTIQVCSYVKLKLKVVAYFLYGNNAAQRKIVILSTGGIVRFL